MVSEPGRLGAPHRRYRRMVTTADGASTGSFDSTDWALTITVAVIWGSSFLWIAIGLDSLSPSTVAFGRLALGAAALWLFPSARRPIPRHVWTTVVVVAIAGNAAPGPRQGSARFGFRGPFGPPRGLPVPWWLGAGYGSQSRPSLRSSRINGLQRRASWTR